MKKVLLYSGGMDSYIIRHLWKPDVCLYIDYGTEQTKQERALLPEGVIVKEVNLGEYMEDDGINTIPLRNLIFAALAVNYGEEIAIGGVKGDFHFDKTKKFARRTTRLFNSVLTKEASHRRVKVVVPYKGYSKKDLVRMYVEAGGDLDKLESESWSCHRPKDGKPCGECVACRKKIATIKAARELFEKLSEAKYNHEILAAYNEYDKKEII